MCIIIRFLYHLHMNTVWQDGQDRDGVDDDDPGDSLPGAGPGVHHGGVCHGLQPVQGDGGQAQSGNVDGNSLHQMCDDKVDFKMASPGIKTKNTFVDG